MKKINPVQGIKKDLQGERKFTPDQYAQNAYAARPFTQLFPLAGILKRQQTQNPFSQIGGLMGQMRLGNKTGKSLTG